MCKKVCINTFLPQKYFELVIWRYSLAPSSDMSLPSEICSDCDILLLALISTILSDKQNENFKKSTSVIRLFYSFLVFSLHFILLLLLLQSNNCSFQGIIKLNKIFLMYLFFKIIKRIDKLISIFQLSCVLQMSTKDICQVNLCISAAIKFITSTSQ